MRVHPVGATGSLLLSSWQQVLFTPRILRFGLTASLLAVRLRRRTPHAPPGRPDGCPCRHERPSAPGGSPDAPEIEHIDRVWPSDLRTDEVARTIETIVPVRIESAMGNYLDIWL